jgi:hypothetical protein
MTETFQPKSETEARLLAAQEGRISGEDFMEFLFKSQVFMPVLDNVNALGIRLSTKTKPLALTAEDGSEVLVLFTSPERAKEFVKDYPGYEGGLLTDFTWVLEKLGTGFGISLNPSWPVGIDIEPEQVQQWIADRQA